jgi:hypothetical protein
MSECQGVFREQKPCHQQVSDLHSPRATDFNSVEVTTRLRSAEINLKTIHHEVLIQGVFQ